MYSSTSISSTSCSPVSSRIMAEVVSADLALLDLVDILVLFELWPSSCVLPSAFLLGVCAVASLGEVCAEGRECRATLSIVSLPFMKLSTASLIAQFPLNLDSWSVARHSGHFPSLASALLMQREQKVWQQEVTIGEL